MATMAVIPVFWIHLILVATLAVMPVFLIHHILVATMAVIPVFWIHHILVATLDVIPVFWMHHILVATLAESYQCFEYIISRWLPWLSYQCFEYIFFWWYPGCHTSVLNTSYSGGYHGCHTSVLNISYSGGYFGRVKPEFWMRNILVATMAFIPVFWIHLILVATLAESYQCFECTILWWLPCQAYWVAASVLELAGWCRDSVTGWSSKSDLQLLSQWSSKYNKANLFFTLQLISDDNRKIIGHDRNSSLRFSSCERHSKLTEEMPIPFRPRTLPFVVDVSVCNCQKWAAQSTSCMEGNSAKFTSSEKF